MIFFFSQKATNCQEYISPCFSVHSDARANLMTHVTEQKYVLLHKRREMIKLSLGCLSFHSSLCNMWNTLKFPIFLIVKNVLWLRWIQVNNLHYEFSTKNNNTLILDTCPEMC